MVARKTTDAAVAAKVETVGFVPAVSFLGFPDGVTETSYRAGKQESAPKDYVDLLRAKGLLAPATEAGIDAPVDDAGTIESEEK